MTTPPPLRDLPHRIFSALAHARSQDFPVILFLLSVITRISGYLTASIWYDEAISLWRAKLPLNLLNTDISELQGFNLWEIILRPFTANIHTLRLPALLLSISSVYVAWRIMRKLHFSQVRITIAMIALATLPGILWMSQDARYYAPMSFFFLCAVWAALENKYFILFCFSGLLVLMHPTGIAWAVAAYLVGFINGMKLRFILIYIPPIAGILIYKLIAIMTNNASSDFWLQTTSPAYLTLQTLLAFFADTMNGWGAILGLATITAIMIPMIKLSTDQNLRTLYLGVITPIVIMLVVSLVYTPVLFYRTIQPVLPLFCILAGYVLEPTRKWFTWFLPAAAAATIILSMANWNPSTRGGDIEQAANIIRRNWQPGDVIYYGTGTVAMPFDYYLPDHHGYMLDGDLNSNISWPGIPFIQTDLETLSARRVWLIYPLEATMAPDDTARLEEYARDGTLVYRVDAIHFAPILVYLLER